MESLKRALWVAVPVFVAALATYLATMPRLITIEDAGLFHGVCATGGIAHPPGYPLFTLICTPLYWLPIDPILLGNGLSALFGAGAAAVVSVILLQLGTRWLPAMFGGLLIAFSASFWSQAIIIEVYSFNALLVMLLLWSCIRFMQTPTEKLAASVALLTGLGISNHYPLVGLTLPGLAIIVLVQWPWIRERLLSPTFIPTLLGAGLLGLAPYLTLLLKHSPEISYSGPIDSWQEFLSYFLRESYADQDNQPEANVLDKVSFLGWIMKNATQQMSWLALAFSITGILFAFPAALRNINIALGLIFLSHTVLLAAVLGFDFQFASAAVFKPYPLIAWSCLAIWAGVGLNWLIGRTEGMKGGTAAPIVPAVAAVILTFATSIEENNRADDWIADAVSTTILASLPPNAAFIVSGDALTFTMLYQRYVAGIRPDVDVFHIDNIVYEKKLIGRSQADRAATALAMTTERPVFSSGAPSLPIEQDYGLFIGHDGSGVQQVARHPRHGAFRTRLIDAYLAGDVIQPHQRVFTSNLLIAFARQLTALASIGELRPGEAADLAKLQQTFPGLIVSMYSALSDDRAQVDGAALVARAFELEADIPPEAVNSMKATFYYYFAEMFLRGKHGIETDRELARLFLLKGFEVWPVPRNPVVCRLRSMAPPPGHAVTQVEFDLECGKRAALAPARAQ